jgi:hypothetical protein
MPTQIHVYVKRLLSIVAEMEKDYPKKRFTLDGRLVGDLGEILAEQRYELTLHEGLTTLHDAISDGRHVQIKTTMKKSLGFSDIPDYYLGLRVDEDGEVDEIYNGPGAAIWEAIKHRKRPKNYLFSVSISMLKQLNETVPTSEKIRKRVARS